MGIPQRARARERERESSVKYRTNPSILQLVQRPKMNTLTLAHLLGAYHSRTLYYICMYRRIWERERCVCVCECRLFIRCAYSPQQFRSVNNTFSFAKSIYILCYRLTNGNTNDLRMSSLRWIRSSSERRENERKRERDRPNTQRECEHFINITRTQSHISHT